MWCTVGPIWKEQGMDGIVLLFNEIRRLRLVERDGGGSFLETKLTNDNPLRPSVSGGTGTQGVCRVVS